MREVFINLADFDIRWLVRAREIYVSLSPVRKIQRKYYCHNERSMGS